MKRAVLVPALETAFIALSPAGVAFATSSPAPPLPVINVDNPGSDVLCSADYTSCWIDRGACAESRPDSPLKMSHGCG